MAPAVKINEEDIRDFHENGVVCLRNVFGQEWVEKSATGIAKNLQNPSQYRYLCHFRITVVLSQWPGKTSDWLRKSSTFITCSESLKAQDGEGAYFNDYLNWDKIDEFKDYVFHSPAKEIVAQLLDTEVSCFHLPPEKRKKERTILAKGPSSILNGKWKETSFMRFPFWLGANLLGDLLPSIDAKCKSEHIPECEDKKQTNKKKKKTESARTYFSTTSFLMCSCSTWVSTTSTSLWRNREQEKWRRGTRTSRTSLSQDPRSNPPPKKKNTKKRQK